MERHIQHPVYGEILYNENFWSGKKTIKINMFHVKFKKIIKKKIMMKKTATKFFQ